MTTTHEADVHTVAFDQAAADGKTLNEYIDEQRDRIFNVQGVIGVARMAAEAMESRGDEGAPDLRNTLHVAYQVLEDICSKLDPVYIEDAKLERTTGDELPVAN